MFPLVMEIPIISAGSLRNTQESPRRNTGRRSVDEEGKKSVINRLVWSADADRMWKIWRNAAGDGSQDDGKIRIGITFDTFVLERWQRDRDVLYQPRRNLEQK